MQKTTEISTQSIKYYNQENITIRVAQINTVIGVKNKAVGYKNIWLRTYEKPWPSSNCNEFISLRRTNNGISGVRKECLERTKWPHKYRLVEATVGFRVSENGVQNAKSNLIQID